MKYKKGQKVKIIANRNRHGFKIGQIVTILKVTDIDYCGDGQVRSRWFDDSECILPKFHSKIDKLMYQMGCEISTTHTN